MVSAAKLSACRRGDFSYVSYSTSSVPSCYSLDIGTHSNLIIYALEAYKPLLRIVRRLLSDMDSSTTQ